MGLRAPGPLGRRGPWAAGLLLAKPAADAPNESGAQVWVPETARRATYMDFSISLNFNFDFFSLLCRDYFKLRFLRMADVNLTLRYMYGLIKKLYQPIHRRKFLLCLTDPDRTSAHNQIRNICTQTQNKISRQSTETNANN